MKFSIIQKPWFHGYTDNLVSIEYAAEMENEFLPWDSDLWEDNGIEYVNEYTHKKILNNIYAMPKCIADFILELQSTEFVSYIENITGIQKLYTDKNLYGGGMVLHPPGSCLTTHIDFNYNHELEMYRAVNLIYYLNTDCDGGNFDMYNTELDLKKSIAPTLNSCILFMPNNKTYHGVSEILSGYRKTISLWYYTKQPTENLSLKPHNTQWIK